MWFGCSLGLRIEANGITRIVSWLFNLLDDGECSNKAKALIACLLWQTSTACVVIFLKIKSAI